MELIMIETYRTPKDMRELSANMKRFYFKAENYSPKRGYNLQVVVYAVSRKDGHPLFLGRAHANTASYKGDHALASQIVAECCGYKMKPGGYELVRKDVTLYEV
jgi:hypothetical protein